jgi:homoserine kinase type II
VRSATLLFRHEDERGLDLELAAAFAAGYRSEVAITDNELDDAVNRLWWKCMCDFWHLVFHYDRADDSCDHLFPSSCLLVDWWTDHCDDVRAAFVTSSA